MKRYIKSNSEFKDYTVIRVDNTRFTVNYTAEDDMLKNIYMHEIHPYDDAEYAYARMYSPVEIAFYRNGKIIDKMQIAEYDEDVDELSFDEYLDDVFTSIATELRNINKYVKPIMLHN